MILHSLRRTLHFLRMTLPPLMRFQQMPCRIDNMHDSRESYVSAGIHWFSSCLFFDEHWVRAFVCNFWPIEDQIEKFLKDRIQVVDPSCMWERNHCGSIWWKSVFLDNDVFQVSSEFLIAELEKLPSASDCLLSLKVILRPKFLNWSFQKIWLLFLPSRNLIIWGESWFGILSV